MNNSNPLDGLDEILSGICETLRQHENLLFEFSASAMALQELLEQKPELAQTFQAIRQRLKREQLGPPHAAQVRLLDNMIARLRGT